MTAPMKTFLSERLSPKMTRNLTRWRRTSGVLGMAVMPDAHLAHDVCVGTVIATENTLFPAAVGGDIGCGVATLALDVRADVITDVVADSLFAALPTAVPIVRHAHDARRSLPDALDPEGLSTSRLQKLARREGPAQLGTLGRGNHFLELQSDPDGRLWVMVHSGSRGLGQGIRDAHARASPYDGLDANSPEGLAYWGDMQWARTFARLSRERMISQATSCLAAVLGAAPVPGTFVDCEHNVIAEITLAGRRVWVHRKGASSAHRDEPGLIPGSMGAPTYHTLGRGCEAAFFSSSHGAGRAMSRSAARRKITRPCLEGQMQGVYFDRRRSSALLEEAPGAYRDIHKVMAAQRQLVRTVRIVSPCLSYKGG